MKTEILKLLKESDSYVSGQELCEKFEVSRTAVWKVVRQLQEEGYQIDAVRNKGYRLTGLADVITEAELKSRIKAQWAGQSIACFSQVDSTNTKAKQLAEAGAVHGTLVIADFQTAGKGRRGRSWVSTPGTGIWMTLVLRPQIEPSHASMLTLVAALAVAAGIEKETGHKALIKWPNDIVVNGKKVCGILTEMSTEMDLIHYVAVGIGINANIDSFPEEISQTATSLRLETGHDVCRSGVIAGVMDAFEEYYELFMLHGDFRLLKEMYESHLANLGREVMVLAPAGPYQGTALGINLDGELLVQTADSLVHPVVSGEVSVRGIYGYV